MNKPRVNHDAHRQAVLRRLHDERVAAAKKAEKEAAKAANSQPTVDDGAPQFKLGDEPAAQASGTEAAVR